MPNMLSYDQFGSLFDDLVPLLQGISLLSQKQGSENIENDIMYVDVFVFGRTHYARCQASSPNDVHSIQDQTKHPPAFDKAS